MVEVDVLLVVATWANVASAHSKRARLTRLLRPMGSPLF
jgi:hypothetical protein